MTYEKYLDYSREELLEKVRVVMSPKRFNHVLGVELLLLLLKSMVTILKKLVWLASFMIMPRSFRIRNS